MIFWFFSVMLRALRFLPGGLGRFIRCCTGANHCRLRVIGWERCGHVLPLGPLRKSAPRVLGSLLILFGYPARSEDALIAGRLRMRYCNVSFANKKPTWGLPREGKVADLILQGARGDGALSALPGRSGDLGVLMDQNRVFPKRIRLNKEMLVHDIGFFGR